MYYLGINYYGHNTSCALERWKINLCCRGRDFQEKNDGSIPIKSIKIV